MNQLEIIKQALRDFRDSAPMDDVSYNNIDRALDLLDEVEGY